MEETELKEEPGQFTPQMMHALFWRMLKDVGGVMVTQAFFDNFQADAKWEAQFDETNSTWRFFVRTQRQRKKIITPCRKVIDHG